MASRSMAGWQRQEAELSVGWWQDPVARALLAGGAYLLLWLGAGELLWWLGRRRGRPLLQGLWGQAAGLLLSAAILFALLILGVLSPDDVGLRRPDQVLTWPIILALWVLEGVWLALLWGRLRSPAPEGQAAAPQAAWLATLCAAAQQETALALFRAAMVPLLGVYWGAWLGMACKGLAGRSHPAMALSLADPERGGGTRLIWALDAMSTALYVLSGSVWVALAGRLVGRGGVALASWLLRQRHTLPADTQGAQT